MLCDMIDEFIICFFFFQAEDGIRDYKVTGVQTCALPISNWWQTKSVAGTQNDPFFLIGWFNPSPGVMRQQLVWWGPATPGPAAGQTEIGRASCRERV